MANKVKYGLKNVYYAVATDNGQGVLSYGTPVRWPGAVSLSLDAQGEMTTFRADNTDYWKGNQNSGYQGDFESALIPDSFRTDVLGEETNATTGIIAEYAGKPTVEFALMFQFEGDQNATRHVLYRCVANRPQISGQTTAETIEPQTESITISAMPRINDDLIKGKAESTASAYANWFTEVQEPTA